jgi:serine/threonine-protein kinase
MRKEGDGAELVAGARTAPTPDRSREALVRAQLTRVLASPGFQGANRRTRLLRYLVGEVLDGRGDSIKELVIATEVFERSPDYDPQVDSLVRVEMGRLRSRLAEYYGQAGAGDPVLIEIPKGGYRPVFVFRVATAESVPRAAAEPAAEPCLKPVATMAREPRHNWRFIVAGTVAAAVLVGAGWLLRTGTTPVAKSIAVLPFLNLSGDPANEYLGDGISEEVTESLAQSADLRVVSRTSAFQYKGKSADIREVGKKLGAGAMLEGSVGRRGEQLHVVAQLIRASDGYHLWSDAYDTGVAELPAVEARIGQAVRQTLDPSAVAAANPANNATPARDPEAHHLYLRAAYEFSRRTAESTRRAIELAQQAVQKDAVYAQPYVLMAAAESQLTTLFAETPHAAAQRASQDVANALALDPANSGAHAQLAILAYADQWNWPLAEREFQAALATGSHGSAENLYGWCLMTRGRFAEARRHLEIAAELDPLSLGPQLNQVEEMGAERKLPEARRKVEQILQTAPNNFVALALATNVATGQRDCAAIGKWSEKLLATFPQVPYAHIDTLAEDGVCGHPERVGPKLDEILSGHPPGYLSPYSLAEVFAIRREADRSISYLRKSADLREPTILMMKIDHTLDSLRQDPRFMALEHRIGLE